MELIVDNFAGGGGASTGIEMAVGRSVDIAINHDPDAIAMHRANHPHTRHYCEDVWQVDPSEACAGNPVGLAWFSPDCTHFSRAKGGKPVDKNIRGLAWVTIRWALKVRPRVIMLENVPEIRTWGPLGADSKPIKERAGETFDGFIKALTAGIPHDHPAFTEMCATLEISPDSPEAAGLEQGLGYNAEYRILRSCDYGAPTTRTRFYLIARCDGKPIVFPPPTHGNGKGLKPYHTAAECIDWSIPAQSIFERDKPLAENTLRRIARGIEKFVINNPEPFIVTVNHSGEGFRGQKADEPLGTVTAKNGYGVVAPTLIQYHSETASDEVRGQELNEPLMTVDTSPRYALSVAHIMKNYGGNYQGAGSGAETFRYSYRARPQQHYNSSYPDHAEQHGRTASRRTAGNDNGGRFAPRRSTGVPREVFLQRNAKAGRQPAGHRHHKRPLCPGDDTRRRIHHHGHKNAHAPAA